MAIQTCSMLDELNRLSEAQGRWPIFAATVIRNRHENWWLMNRQDRGWSESGIPYDSLDQIAKLYAVRFIEAGQDGHSIFMRIEPRQEQPR